MATVAEAKKKADTLRKTLRELERITGKTGDAERKAGERAAARDLVIPEVGNPDRRAAAEANDVLWLETYLPDVFYNPFTIHQLRIVADCGEVLRYGTQKCKAAPRGDGKSSIIKYLALKYALTRQVAFPLVVAATAAKAHKTLNSLKRRLASRGPSLLAEDYPLECQVARYVDPWPSRARNVTANGRKSINVQWGGDMIVLPTWEATEPLGPILLALGITSDELQGCNVYDQRPDFVMLDDLDSRDSLAAEDGVIAEKIEEAIDKTIAGLGGQSRRLGQFMLCTITSRESAAFKYSDPAQKPSWSGERIAALTAWPERKDLWETYVELRKWGQGTLDDNGRPVDVFGRKAHQHYADNFDEMNRGAVLSNPHNYQKDLLPDGTPTHLSALQRCYDYIADNGMASFLTEMQNDPPEDEGLTESGISVRAVQSQTSGFDQGIIPEGCTLLVHGVDVGKWWLHWVVRAFRPDGTGFVIDYGRQNVYETKHGSEEGLDRAIRREVLRRVEEFREQPYSQQIRDSLTLVDSGYRTEAIYAACAEAGLGVMPIKGIGLSAGVAERGRFNDVMKRTRDKQPVCDGVYYSTIREPGRPAFKLVCASADQWKAWEHDRWMTARDKAGCMFLYGDKAEAGSVLNHDQRAHGHYAHHICAEVEVEDVVKGGLVRRWQNKNKENHWLDASYYADVAAAIKGVRVMGDAVKSRLAPDQRPTARQMAQGVRR
jgi:hypothetical protein